MVLISCNSSWRPGHFYSSTNATTGKSITESRICHEVEFPPRILGAWFNSISALSVIMSYQFVFPLKKMWGIEWQKKKEKNGQNVWTSSAAKYPPPRTCSHPMSAIVMAPKLWNPTIIFMINDFSSSYLPKDALYPHHSLLLELTTRMSERKYFLWLLEREDWISSLLSQ